MSALLDAIAGEISQREQRRETLHDELLAIVDQLEQLRTMAEQAESLNGDGASVPPKPVEPPEPRVGAKGGQVSTSPGRKGGDAPGGRRPQSAGRRPGSAPSRSPRTAPDTSSEGGGTKRSAVLAYVAQHERCKVSDIVRGTGLTAAAVKQHLYALRDAGQVQGEGATSSRVYFTTANGDRAAATKPHLKSTDTTAPLRQTKDRVLKAITADPGGLNEVLLAVQLDLDREDVAVAVGELLEADQLYMHPTGTLTVATAKDLAA